MIIHTERFGKVSSHMNGQVSATCMTPITKTVQQSAENGTLSSMCPGIPLGHSSLQWVATSDQTYTCRTRGQGCGRTLLWTNIAGHLATVSGHSRATGSTQKNMCPDMVRHVGDTCRTCVYHMSSQVREMNDSHFLNSVTRLYQLADN